MRRLDGLTSVALALVGGALYAAVATWLAGWMVGAGAPAVTVYAGAFPAPGALIAWLMLGPGRLPDWRYTWLAPLPFLFWTLALPMLEGARLQLMDAFRERPLSTAVEVLVVYLCVPLFGWVFSRRRAGSTAR